MGNLFKKERTNAARQDLSKKTKDVYTIIKPYTRGSGKGSEWLNDTKYPKKVKTGTINVQEQIDSYRDETNYHILIDKFNKGELIGLKETGQYLDVSGLSRMNEHEIRTANIKAEEKYKALSEEEKLLIAKIMNFGRKVEPDKKDEDKEEEKGDKQE